MAEGHVPALGDEYITTQTWLWDETDSGRGGRVMAELQASRNSMTEVERLNS